MPRCPECKEMFDSLVKEGDNASIAATYTLEHGCTNIEVHSWGDNVYVYPCCFKHAADNHKEANDVLADDLGEDRYMEGVG